MKTQEEILARIKLRKTNDVFGFEIGNYVSALTFENAKPFLKAEATKEDWADLSETSKEHWIEAIKDYMSFAEEKADNERGLSANRSISHFIAWTWLADDDEFSAKINKMLDTDYAPYGKPILREIAEFYNMEKAK